MAVSQATPRLSSSKHPSLVMLWIIQVRDSEKTWMCRPWRTTLSGRGSVGWWELEEPGRATFLQAHLPPACLVPGPGGLAAAEVVLPTGTSVLRPQSRCFGIWTRSWWRVALGVLVPANKADGDPAWKGTRHHCHWPDCFWQSHA